MNCDDIINKQGTNRVESSAQPCLPSSQSRLHSIGNIYFVGKVPYSHCDLPSVKKVRYRYNRSNKKGEYN